LPDIIDTTPRVLDTLPGVIETSAGLPVSPLAVFDGVSLQ